MKTFAQIAADIAPKITEMMPWDAEEFLQANPETLIVDIRETHEYDTMHIPDSINVPRGILENACEWDFEETEPELVKARQRPVLLACRSGNRTTLAAYTLQLMGYEKVVSRKNRSTSRMPIAISPTRFCRNSAIPIARPENRASFSASSERGE
jgi:rhodanese-related sulfurtransferase